MSHVLKILQDSAEKKHRTNDENIKNGIQFLRQGFGNTMPTCLTWSHFIPDKLKISIYLSFDKCKCIKLIQFCISYFDYLL